MATATEAGLSMRMASRCRKNKQLLGALLAKQFLLDNPGAAVVYDLRTSHIVRDTVAAYGGKPIRSKVGGPTIKTHMREAGAVLGIEASGHYYFRDDYYSDSGFIAVMSAVNILASPDNQHAG